IKSDLMKYLSKDNMNDYGTITRQYENSLFGKIKKGFNYVKNSKVGRHAQKAVKTLGKEAKLWTYELPKTLIRENLGVPEGVSTKDRIKNYIKEHKLEFAGEIIGTAIIGYTLDALAWGKYGFHTEGGFTGGGNWCTIYLNPFLYPFSYLFGSGSFTTTKTFGEAWDFKESNRLLHKPYYYALGALFSFSPRIGYEIYKRLKRWKKKE
ncbi:MAG: hypothetical protein ACTSX6_07550, partial [Candidatus Heimdallarchaeaceae archaeon]